MQNVCPLPEHYFSRYDESDDSLFYKYPRLTVHIDDPAVAAVNHLFKQELPPDGAFLDLMSSYRSHFPLDLPVKRLVGLGLSAAEMQHNPQLHEVLVHDLNKYPSLPFQDALFDGVVCTVSIQYLVHPVDVFAEVGRILKPDGVFIVTFSNRYFPSKAVRVWIHSNDQQRRKLVRSYFTWASVFTNVRDLDRSPNRWLSDPIFAVVGRRVL